MNVSEEQKVRTRALIAEGRNLEAIKYVRKELNLDLRTATKLVEAIRATMDPAEIKPSAATGSRSGCAMLVPGIFVVLGLIMLGVCIYIYSSQQQLINNGEKTTAIVISNPSSPVFEYTYDGDTYQYQSSTSSDPPSYYTGEEVDIYVNKNDPYDTLIDTFTDRWLVITILGGMGTMFSGMGFLVLFLFRKRT